MVLVSAGHAEVLPFASPAARPSRRLYDKLLVAFHQACDHGDFEIAVELLSLLEIMAQRRARPQDGDRRRVIENLVAAYQRLWNLRHPVID